MCALLCLISFSLMYRYSCDSTGMRDMSEETSLLHSVEEKLLVGWGLIHSILWWVGVNPLHSVVGGD